MTFSAKQQLSGWQAPAAGSEEEGQSRFTPAGIRPRLFVVFEDGGGYELLDQDLFTAYAQRKVWHPLLHMPPLAETAMAVLVTKSDVLPQAVCKEVSSHHTGSIPRHTEH